MKGLVITLLLASYAHAATHPVLLGQDRINQLATPGNAEYQTIKTYCDSNLNTVIDPGYAGWGWRGAVEDYGTCYQVSKIIDPTNAAAYGKKALGIMKALAHDHAYIANTLFQPIGLGNGAQTAFTLPFTPMPGATISVMLVNVNVYNYTYGSAAPSLPHFAPIMKISDTSGGPANYSSSDYYENYRDTITGNTFNTIRWLTSSHPASGAAYYVTVADGGSASVASGQYTVQNGVLTFTTPPSAAQAVFVSYLGNTYEQTGSHMGGPNGVNAVEPDGPGYPMRAFCVGLAEGYDYIYDLPDFTAALKTEFYALMNQEVDWYTQWGYNNQGPYQGNYFVEGYLTSTFYMAYATDPDNPRAASLQALATTLVQDTYGSLANDTPGGYGPQGDYNVGLDRDVLNVFTLYKNVTGQDLLSRLEWTSNLIPTLIHGTKPDRATFYDGGDWSQYPAAATVWSDTLSAFLRNLPNHPTAPYARQLMQDIGLAVPAGAIQDYKTSFPTAYLAKGSGPMYARSDWSAGAVWVSLQSGKLFEDHQHRDQGHVTLQRGGDYLLVGAGGYGYTDTAYSNTILFDDRGAGNISTYPPGQGYWGKTDSIVKFEQAASYAYGEADYTRSYVQADGCSWCSNSVEKALRSVVLLRPDVIVVHDQAQTYNPNVKKIFNLNFLGNPVNSGGVYVSAQGSSKLFMLPVVPANVSPTIVSGVSPGNSFTYYNYQETSVGQSTNTFLHVFEATDKSQASMAPVSYIQAADRRSEGVEVAMTAAAEVVMFAVSTQTLTQGIQYAATASGAQNHLLTDLLPYTTYQLLVTSGGQTVLSESLPSSAQGTLNFSFNSAGPVVVTAVPSDPAIVQQPASQTVVADSTVTFSVQATGTLPIAYQWQKESPGGSSFNNISGASSASYTTPAVTTADDGAQYRCVVSNASGTATSSAATLTVGSNSGPPVILQQPQDAALSAGAGESFSFHVAAVGAAPKYQWQREDAGASTFANISGATQSTYTVAASEDMDEALFRCVVSNSFSSVTSSTASLHFPGVTGIMAGSDLGLDYTYNRNGMQGHFHLTLPRTSLPLGSKVKIIRADQMASAVVRYKHTGMGLHINTWGLEPGAVAQLSLDTVSGVDTSKTLTLAYYNPSSRGWEAVPTTSSGGQWVATLSHFSTYALMQASPANDLSAAKVYPNPFRPSQGHTVVTFASLPVSTRIRIYTLSGEKVKELSADSTGAATWDVHNDGGAQVASGVYFAVMEGNGQKKILNVAVQR